MPGLGINLGVGRVGRLARPGALGAALPASIAAKKVAFYDAEQPGQFTLAGASVSAWTADGVAMAQSVTAAKPLLVPDAFGGRPGVVFDGADDCLLVTPLPNGWGSGAAPVSYHAMLSFNRLAATTEIIVAVGAVALTARQLRRSASSYSQMLTGDGVTNTINPTSPTKPPVLQDQRCLLSGIVTASNVASGVNMDLYDPVPAVSNTAATRARFGAGVSTAASAFSGMTLNCLLICAPLTASERAELFKFMDARRYGR